MHTNYSHLILALHTYSEMHISDKRTMISENYCCTTFSVVEVQKHNMAYACVDELIPGRTLDVLCHLKTAPNHIF